jgi:hypothetical protein
LWACHEGCLLQGCAACLEYGSVILWQGLSEALKVRFGSETGPGVCNCRAALLIMTSVMGQVACVYVNFRLTRQT